MGLVWSPEMAAIFCMNLYKSDTSLRWTVRAGPKELTVFLSLYFYCFPTFNILLFVHFTHMNHVVFW